MADNEMKIILEMIDNASPAFRQANAGIISEIKKTENAFQKNTVATDNLSESTKKASNSFEQASKGLREFRRNLFAVTAVLAIAVKGLNDAAQYNEEAARTSNDFNKSLKTLSATLGLIFEPAIKALTYFIQLFSDTIKAALGGFIKLFSFVFEFLSQLPDAFRNVFDNIKAVFTGEDPIGIVDGFRQAFDRAVEVAEIATDQILNKFEETRARIDAGQTIEKQKAQEENLGKIVIKVNKQKEKAAEDRAKKETELYEQSLSQLEEGFKLAASHNKAAAIAFKVYQTGKAIIATARAITEALPNLALAAFVAAAGAAQIAVIQAQTFHKGGVIRAHDGLAVDEVPIIAQRGEGILSRKGMSALGGESRLDSLNRGIGNGVNTIQIFIQSAIMDSQQSIAKTAEELGFLIERNVRAARGI